MTDEPVVTVATEVQDRKIQREKLAQFFRDNSMILWSQDTLADMCGAHRGAIRTRISELKRSGMNLVSHSANFRDKDGVYHRAPKSWQFVPRPAEPLARDAGTRTAAQLPLLARR